MGSNGFPIRTSKTDSPRIARQKKGDQTPQSQETGPVIISEKGDIVIVVEHAGKSSSQNSHSRTEKGSLAATNGSSETTATSQHTGSSLFGGLTSSSTEPSLGPSQRSENQSHECHYRVETRRLKEASPYFARLLDPDKFGEGSAVAEQHKQLAPSQWEDVPLEKLPQVRIADVGRISTVKSIRPLMADFFNILHGNEPSGPNPPPIANIANLAIVADRFDALSALQHYTKKYKLFTLLDAKPSSKTPTSSEERIRQRLLLGLLLDNTSWVWTASTRLIHRGWVGHNPDLADHAPLWWDLPSSVEHELLFRRACILETFESLQSHFLALYTSRDRQCKLGYDSSPECDLYQLGQMVRFFRRVGTLALSGTLLPKEHDNDGDGDDDDGYEGEIADLLESLRQCPAYQIDKNHAHCGLRTRLVPLLDLLEVALQDVGLCLQCWNECRQDCAWSRVKRPLMWRVGSGGGGLHQASKRTQAQSHLVKHLDTRELFMAAQRLWTTDGEGGMDGMQKFPRRFASHKWLDHRQGL
ncbi:hypothetical protein M8818_003317 [Zalaria obscura]|uniref:Uncharacterized protein n=1 Tax=Zalaria obscura TaxID=2024903 RepID=A0ACC3SFF4_9PEZI